MTAPTFLRRRVATRRPRAAVLVAVRDYWQVSEDGPRRQVVVRTPAGVLETRFVSDEHPALVHFLERAAVAA